MSGEALQVAVWRGGREGRFVAYPVPRRANQTVLDVVTWIQRHLEPGLGYRFACRVGMCGSCAMSVNGVPRWTCRTQVARVVGAGGELELAPLRGLPVVRDLAVDLAPMFERWARARARFVPAPGAGRDFAAIAPDSAARRAADAAIECIGCGVCQAACDIAAWNPAYLGPAALNRAWAAHNDERDGDGGERLAAVAGDGGCHGCHSERSCTEHCPKGLDPSASIAALKRATVRAVLGGRLR